MPKHKQKFEVGEPVWGLLDGYPSWWPARVIEVDEAVLRPDQDRPKVMPGEQLIEWFNNNSRYSVVPCKQIRAFWHHRYRDINKNSKPCDCDDLRDDAVVEAIDYSLQNGWIKPSEAAPSECPGIQTDVHMVSSTDKTDSEENEPYVVVQKPLVRSLKPCTVTMKGAQNDARKQTDKVKTPRNGKLKSAHEGSTQSPVNMIPPVKKGPPVGLLRAEKKICMRGDLHTSGEHNDTPTRKKRRMQKLDHSETAIRRLARPAVAVGNTSRGQGQKSQARASKTVFEWRMKTPIAPGKEKGSGRQKKTVAVLHRLQNIDHNMDAVLKKRIVRGKEEPILYDIENSHDDVRPSAVAWISGSKGDGRSAGGNSGSKSRDVEQITSLGGVQPNDGSAKAEVVVVKDKEKYPASDAYKNLSKAQAIAMLLKRDKEIEEYRQQLARRRLEKG